MAMLRGMVKSRRESVELYTQGNRPELAAKETAEIAVIESFLPSQMDPAATEQAVATPSRRPGPRASRIWARVMAALRAQHAATHRHGQGRSDGQSPALGLTAPGDNAAMALPTSFTDELRARTPISGGDRTPSAAGAVGQAVEGLLPVPW